MTTVAIAHDYLTQRGGAERVALAMARMFAQAPIYTSLYLPDGTFEGFEEYDVRTSVLDRVEALRRDHRLALPLLAPVWSRTTIAADVTICSSSGWAHGADTAGAKVVYCHAPARWLYQSERYLGERSGSMGRIALEILRPALLPWDRRAAATADCYVANSTATQEAIRVAYGRDAEVLHPPHMLGPEGPVEPVPDLEPGYLLTVCRLLPYKNVSQVVEAFRDLPDARLVVVGVGPDFDRLWVEAPTNVTLLGAVDDSELRWLYASSAGLVSASFEDLGLTPLEAFAFGKPVAVLRFGGFLDTVVEGETGVFFDAPTPQAIRRGVRELRSRTWDTGTLRARAEEFSEQRFAARLQDIVSEVAGRP